MLVPKRIHLTIRWKKNAHGNLKDGLKQVGTRSYLNDGVRECLRCSMVDFQGILEDNAIPHRELCLILVVDSALALLVALLVA